MDHAAYVRVLLSVWVGLGLGEIVKGFNRLVRFKGDVRWDWLPLAWAGLAFLMVVQIWWAYFTLLQAPVWANLFAFLFPLLAFVLIYLICASALPDVSARPANRAHHGHDPHPSGPRDLHHALYPEAHLTDRVPREPDPGLNFYLSSSSPPARGRTMSGGQGHSQSKGHGGHGGGHYRGLGIMTVLSFLSMFVLMYAMVDRLDNIYANVNQAYMAGLMASPMLIIELLVMRSMYPNRRLNALIIGGAGFALVLFLVLIQRQVGVSDGQFLRSMIPHHAAALLMCQEAPIEDAEIERLCGGIMESQQSEISLMKTLLGDPEGGR